MSRTLLVLLYTFTVFRMVKLFYYQCIRLLKE